MTIDEINAYNDNNVRLHVSADSITPGVIADALDNLDDFTAGFSPGYENVKPTGENELMVNLFTGVYTNLSILIY